FLSSRRRHRISKRDWSSDVCSSDLVSTNEHAGRGPFPKEFPCPYGDILWRSTERRSSPRPSLPRSRSSALPSHLRRQRPSLSRTPHWQIGAGSTSEWSSTCRTLCPIVTSMIRRRPPKLWPAVSPELPAEYRSIPSQPSVPTEPTIRSPPPPCRLRIP